MPSDVRWAAELWLDIYMDVLAGLLDPAPDHGFKNLDAAETARIIADRALANIQERWPGIRI